MKPRPSGARSDGEDSNFGLVNNADEPNAEMVAAMADINRYAPHLRLCLDRTAARAILPVTELREGAIVKDHLAYSIDGEHSLIIGQ